MKTLAEILKPEIESGMKSLKGRAPEVALMSRREYNEILAFVSAALQDYEKHGRTSRIAQADQCDS